MAPRRPPATAPGRRLRRLERWLEGPMVFLAFVWIGLMILEFAGGQRPWLEMATNVIWGIFVADFLLRLALAPAKGAYVRRNWLTLVSLALPALRIFRLARVLRLARATRGLRLLRLATSLNRSTRALMKSMGRQGLGYIVALTLVVTGAGAAGMYALEEGQFASYWDALWWTAMVVTTMGSDFWPRTPEGRLLCLALAIYAFSIFGYVTAALASFLVGRSQGAGEAGPGDLQQELAALRREVARLADLSPPGGRPASAGPGPARKRHRRNPPAPP